MKRTIREYNLHRSRRFGRNDNGSSALGVKSRVEPANPDVGLRCDQVRRVTRRVHHGF